MEIHGINVEDVRAPFMLCNLWNKFEKRYEKIIMYVLGTSFHFFVATSLLESDI